MNKINHLFSSKDTLIQAVLFYQDLLDSGYNTVKIGYDGLSFSNLEDLDKNICDGVYKLAELRSNNWVVRWEE